MNFKAVRNVSLLRLSKKISKALRPAEAILPTSILSGKANRLLPKGSCLSQIDEQANSEAGEECSPRSYDIEPEVE